jgi:transposase-like protein
MFDLKDYEGFCIEQQDHSPEANAISLYCLVKDIKLLKIKSNEICPSNYVPSGSVDFCIKSLGKNIIPDYYPDWCKSLLFRNVWKENKWLLRKVFIKPADIHKRFTGFITTGTYKKKKKPPFWCSDIVKFTDEYRYYISNGKVVFSAWYWNEENIEGIITTPPELKIDIPNGWCGTIDMGYLSTGEFALIECHSPHRFPLDSIFTRKEERFKCSGCPNTLYYDRDVEGLIVDNGADGADKQENGIIRGTCPQCNMEHTFPTDSNRYKLGAYFLCTQCGHMLSFDKSTQSLFVVKLPLVEKVKITCKVNNKNSIEYFKQFRHIPTYKKFSDT